MSDPLADLKRRAYARPDDDGVAVAAQAQLARLADEQKRAALGTNIPIPEAPPSTTVGVRGRNILAIAAVVAIAAATVAVLTRPIDSLQVFESPPSSADPAPPEWMVEVLQSPGYSPDAPLPDTLRWLGEYKESSLFGYRSELGGVCLLLMIGDGASGTCAPAADFAEQGMTLESMRRPNTEREFITVNWGPFGPPQFSDEAPS